MARAKSDGPSERVTHAEKQRHGERSSELARALMGLSDSEFDRLELDEGLRDDVSAARGITSPVAKKRAERRLAGILRAEGLEEIRGVLDAHHQTQRQGARQFQLIEKIREKVLAGDDSAVAVVVSDPTTGEWPQLVDDARREHAVGKPKGAKKRLFRALAAAREQQLANAQDG